MADRIADVDSEGVYSGMSLEDFGVRVGNRNPRSDPAAEKGTQGAVPMPRETLRKSIAHLRGELASDEPLSAEDRERLDRVLGEVSKRLDADGDAQGKAEAPQPEDDGELFDELRDFAERFEESHPKMALVVGRIMDSLSQLGI